MDDLFSEVVSNIIELISNVDISIEEIDGLNSDIEIAIATGDHEAIKKYRDHLVSACDLLEKFEKALRDDVRPSKIFNTLNGLVFEISSEELQNILSDHKSTLNELCPNEISSEKFISYVSDKLLETYNELTEDNDGKINSKDINPAVILGHISDLKKQVCRASKKLDSVVETLTLKQYQDFLVETSEALKDVVIVGADIVVLTTDITFVLAAKSGFSIFSGVRSLGQRIGNYKEKVISLFGHQ